MKSAPGFLTELYQQLESLPLETLERINRQGGLEIGDLLEWITNPKDLSVSFPEDVDPAAIVKIEEISSEAFWEGRAALTNGVAAHCVVCDENSLKMFPDSLSSRLELQLMRLSWVKEVWVLVHPDLKEEVKKICDSVGSKASIITNYETFQLMPDNLLAIEDEVPVLKSCGSGDLVNSMRTSGVFDRFIQGGGEYIVVSHGNNFLGARPACLGAHIFSQKPVTCEVTKKSSEDDQSHILCEYGGFSQLVEIFRFSSREHYDSLPYVDAGTLIFNANLDFDSLQWKWHRRKIAYNKKLTVQFERTLCDLTSNFQTQFVYTPRKYLK